VAGSVGIGRILTQVVIVFGIVAFVQETTVPFSPKPLARSSVAASRDQLDPSIRGKAVLTPRLSPPDALRDRADIALSVHAPTRRTHQ